MRAKTTMPCLPPPPAPDRPGSASQLTVKSCGASSKTRRQPKSCGSFRGGSSRWWRRRSRKGGGGVVAAQEVEVLRRRRQQMKTLQDLSMRQTKTIHRQVLTANLKGPSPNPFRTKIRPQTPLCTHRRSEVILRTRHPIILLTCPC